MKLFRNKSTNENVRKLACILFNYEKRGYTSIGLELLQLAGIGTVSDEDVRTGSPRLKSQLKKYTDYLIEAGFIELVSKSYKAGVFRRPFHVKKDAILDAYGTEAVESARAILGLKVKAKERTVSDFVKEIEAKEIEANAIAKEIHWEIIAPGEIEFRRGRRHLRTVKFLDKYGKQRFMVKSFYGIKDAMIEFVRSIRYEIPGEDIEEKIAFINSKVSTEFQMEFKVHFTLDWTDSGKSFIAHKATRSVSPFCGYGKKNGERDKKLLAEGLSGDFDIKSCVPRLTYYMNRGVWLDMSKDLYTMVYEASGLTREWTPALRDHLKMAFFNLYFVDVPYRSWGAYKNNDKIEKMVPLCDRFSQEEVLKLFKAVRDVMLEPRGPGIFYEESLVEIEVMYRVLKSGRRIVNVFDGFYFGDDISKEEISSLITEVVGDVLKERMQ